MHPQTMLGNKSSKHTHGPRTGPNNASGSQLPHHNIPHTQRRGRTHHTHTRVAPHTRSISPKRERSRHAPRARAVRAVHVARAPLMTSSSFGILSFGKRGVTTAWMLLLAPAPLRDMLAGGCSRALLPCLLHHHVVEGVEP